ncbi:MAG: hypothetical protein HOL61_14195 [Rhodospirillaceae bacterium]|jgi:hypothetical protein|nr:hypothetical protein [Rhodospirillaceae bacterium]
MAHSLKFSFSVAAALTAIFALTTGDANAKMKAKYCKECYAAVEQARDMIPEPKTDVAGSAGKLGSAAGALGKIGGFGGFGGLGKVAQTAATVQQYSGYVASAAALTEKMQSSYPDPADRILAYGEQLGEDANNIQTGSEGLETAQQCYDDAYTQLVADFEAGSIKKRDAKKRHKEIQKGMIEISGVLADAQSVMDSNLQNYNEALTTETTGMGLNLGDLAQAASLAKGVAGSSGVAGAGGCQADFATCSRRDAALRARAAGGWGGLYTANDPMGAAPTPPAGMSYSQFGIMNDFAMMGNMGAVSSLGSSALVSAGSQATIGSLQSAINNRNDPKPETVIAAAPVQQAQPVQPQVSQQMMSSLQAAGVSSEKFMESYGQVALTTQRQFEVSSKVGQKAGW